LNPTFLDFVAVAAADANDGRTELRLTPIDIRDFFATKEARLETLDGRLKQE
jgi:hypothetical protein